MRAVDPDILAAIASGVWRPVIAVRLDWPTGEVRYHSRQGPLDLDGEIWQGVGGLGSIDAVAETGGVKVRDVELGLTGFLADQIAKVRGVIVRNRPAEIRLGAVDESGRQIGQTVGLHSGQMRSKSFEFREATQEAFRHQIRVVVQSHTQAVRRPVDVRHEHPRLAALRNESVTWPE